MKYVIVFLALSVTAQAQVGLGKSTFTCIDKDGDGYGVGPGCLGPDADDNDATVQSAAQGIAKYGSLQAFLAHLGYAPSHIFYMATNGNDSTAVPDDPTHPYQTWQAINVLMSKGTVGPGSMVMFRAGTWTNTTLAPVSGASNNPLILMAYPGELATLDNTGNGNNSITFQDQSYVTVDGFKVTGGGSTGSGCISGGSSDSQSSSTFHDNIFRHIEATGCGQGIILMNGLLNISIEDSLFHDSSSGGQHCIYLGARELPNVNVFVHRNVCYNAAWNGLHLNGRFTNLQVDQNIIYDVEIAGISLQEGVSNSFFRNNLVFGAASNEIEISNYPGDCAQFGQGGSGAICPYDQTGNLFENNTIYHTGYDPVSGATTQQPAILVNNYSVNQVGNLGQQVFRNNIIVGYGLNGHYPPVVFQNGNQNYLTTSTFMNNDFWPLDGATDPYGIGLGFNSNYGFQGYTCAQATSVTNISGCMNTNPAFVNVNPANYATPAVFNFALQPGSPMIGAGTSTGAPTADLVGNSRPNPPAIGVYEPNSATPPPAPPAITVVSVSCNPASLVSGGSASCAVILSQNAPSGGTTVALASNAQVLTVPATVTVLAGSTTATFTATADTVPSGQTAQILATVGNSSASASVTLATTLIVSSFSCTATSLSSRALTSCTVGLSAAAGSSGVSVSLSSNTTSLSVPASVSVPSGSATASFTITAGTVSSAQTAVLTASFGGASLTVSMALTPPPIVSTASIGWQDLANTTLQAVAPVNCTGISTPAYCSGVTYKYNANAHNVIDAWGSAAWDTTHNRGYFWGGGHVDYNGNEVYKLDIAASSVARMTDPSAFASSGETNADGTPVSRHTYQDLVWLPIAQKIFSYGGILAPSGSASAATWLWDPTLTTGNNGWTKQANGPGGSVGGEMCVLNSFNPSESVICMVPGIYDFFVWTESSNTWSRLTNIGSGVPFNSTMTIDSKRGNIIFAGSNYNGGLTSGIYVATCTGSCTSPSNITYPAAVTTTGCSALYSAPYPGLVYDPVIDRIVGYPGSGNTVYLYNEDTMTCTAQTFTGGPSNSSVNGIFGRFEYLPALDAFVVVNTTTDDAFLLKLSSSSIQVSACDLNADGVVNGLDVAIALNQALGLSSCGNAALQGNGQCTVVDVQRVINASLGGSCLTGQ